jgi:hypothetical protein
MGVAGGPDLIQDGLVLSLDASDRNSYVSGSTTWFDLSGLNNSGSLINGPTFNTGSLGSIVFDGTNDYAAISNFVGNLTTFSVSHFIYLNSNQNTRTIFSNYGVGNNGWVTGIRDDQNNVFKFYLGATVHLYSNTVFSSLTWYHAAITYDNGSPKIYINGILDASSSSTLTPASSYYGNDVGRLGVGSQYFDGRISNLQVYNRALTASEILQNYNAQKSKFGL